MQDYVECVDCGFVVLAAQCAEPAPKRVDDCPRCESTDFRPYDPGSE